MRVWIGLLLAGGLAAFLLFGNTSRGAQSILIEDARAMSHGGALIGVTLSIRNTGDPDRLVSAHVQDAKMAIVKGENAQPLPIPARSTVSLTMEGAHIMLGGVPGEMRDGRLIPLTLTFEQAGEIAAKARFGAMAKMDHGSMNHGAMDDEAMAMMGTDYIVPEDEPAPTLSLSAEPSLQGGYDIAIRTTNFSFSRDQADGPHAPGTGHGHLYIGGVKLGRVYGYSATVPPLPPGEQIVRVTLNTNDHRIYVVNGEPVSATVRVGR
jgi:copper(I)-binding protein